MELVLLLENEFMNLVNFCDFILNCNSSFSDACVGTGSEIKTEQGGVTISKSPCVRYQCYFLKAQLRQNVFLQAEISEPL